jgi:iron complex transport system substrate-binding protein
MANRPPRRPPRTGGFFTPARAALLIVVVAALVIVVVALQSGSATTKQATPSPTAAGGGFPTPIASRGAPQAVYPQQLAGADGKTITISAAPKRIAALAAGAAEILFGVGAGGQVAGVVAAEDYPGTMANVARIDPAGGAAAVAALQPDLVLIGDGSATLAAQIAAQGLPVLVLQPAASVDGVLQQIQFFGNVTNHLQEAQKLAAGLRARIDAVQRRLGTPGPTPRVYLELASGQQAAAAGSLGGDLLRLLGAQNIAPQNAGPQPALTTQQIAAANPDVIIVAAGGAGESVSEVAARDGWSGIAAVQANRVFEIGPDLVSRPGPRIVDGLEALAKLLFPGKF